MHWDVLSLFHHPKLLGTSPRSRSTTNPKIYASREYQAIKTRARITRDLYSKKESQRTQGFVTRVQSHTLMSMPLLRNPQRVDHYTYVTFLPPTTTKIELELLT
jgi:hypothetical protein